jgi:hypothetical protein
VVTANGFSANVFSPNAEKVDASNGARLLSNRPDYHTTYNGFELSLKKRLADRWFSRVAFSWNNYVEHLGAGAIQNPTRTDTTGGLLAFAGPQVDGGQYAPRSSGSGKGDIFYNAKWQLNANALYQLPMGFEVAGNLFGRQGYARPFVLRLSGGRDGAMRIAVGPNDDPWIVDSFGKIYQWVGNGWRQYPGAARDIGIGVDGSVLIVGYGSVVTNTTVTTNASSGTIRASLRSRCDLVGLNPDDGGVYRWTGTGWQQLPGGANHIAVSSDGKPWLVNSCGTISQWMGSAWQQIPGAAMDIGANGVIRDLHVRTTIWIVGSTPASGGYGTSKWNGNGWESIDGGAMAISVGPSGNAWIAANDGSIWEYLSV